MMRWLLDGLRKLRSKSRGYDWSDFREPYHDEITPFLNAMEPTIAQDKDDILAALRHAGCAVVRPEMLADDRLIRALAELTLEERAIMDEDQEGRIIVVVTRRGLEVTH